MFKGGAKADTQPKGITGIWKQAAEMKRGASREPEKTARRIKPEGARRSEIENLEAAEQ